MYEHVIFTVTYGKTSRDEENNNIFSKSFYSDKTHQLSTPRYETETYPTYQ